MIEKGRRRVRKPDTSIMQRKEKSVRTSDIALASARRETLTGEVRERVIVGFVSGGKGSLGQVVVRLVLERTEVARVWDHRRQERRREGGCFSFDEEGGEHRQELAYRRCKARYRQGFLRSPTRGSSNTSEKRFEWGRRKEKGSLTARPRLPSVQTAGQRPQTLGDPGSLTLAVVEKEV
jgi:hypothetical protein